MSATTYIVYASVFVLGGLTGLAVLLQSRKDLTARKIWGSMLLPSLLSFMVTALQYGEISEGDNQLAPAAIAIAVAAVCSVMSAYQVAGSILATMGGRLSVLAKLIGEALTKEDKP